MSKIEIRDNTIDYHGHTLRVFAVYLDGHLASNEFERFAASADLISSTICYECYASSRGTFTCGEPEIAARRHGDFVYWYLTERGWSGPLAALGQVWSFPVASYESQLEGSTADLPDFDISDVRSILNGARIFPWQLGLYTIPEIEDDPQGRALLDNIQEVAATDDMTICDAPGHFRTIRIGIETEGVPETIIEIGSIDSKPAVRFVANPAFPLWLTSELIQRRFAKYLQ